MFKRALQGVRGGQMDVSGPFLRMTVGLCRVAGAFSKDKVLFEYRLQRLMVKVFISCPSS